MAAAARKIQVRTETAPPFPACSAWSPDALYGLLLARGQSGGDVNRDFTLDVTIRALWIRALRSGRYSQHFGNWHYRHWVCAVEVILHELGYRDCGPREPLIETIGQDLCGWVMVLNDREGWSFKRIANWLETRAQPVCWWEERYLTSPVA